MPVLMLVLMCLPGLLMNVNISEARSIGVVDNSGVIAGGLQDNELAKYTRVDIAPDSMYSREDYDGFVIINSDILTNPSGVTLYTRDAGSMELERSLSENIANIIENERLKQLEKTDVKEVLESVRVDVSMSTFRLTDGEASSGTSSIISYAIGIVMSVLLYMFLLMYGQMVMTSIIEEKITVCWNLSLLRLNPHRLCSGKLLVLV